MITDKRTIFCDGVALDTGVAGTYLIGDVIDIEALRDLGQGTNIYLVATVETTATSGGSATLQLKLSSDAQAAIATDGSATDHIVSAEFAVADLGAGKSLIAAALPLEGAAYERYIGVLQVTGTAAFTAGAVDVFLTPDVAKWKAYADGKNFI